MEAWAWILIWSLSIVSTLQITRQTLNIMMGVLYALKTH
jgi:hypothetical protein